jgi:HD-like signal output (HDOD) protein
VTNNRILFVDDEQAVLDGLRNRLRKQRRSWDMVFALGGPAGLEELARAPFDVVVSDMRMPSMDGAALLQAVKEMYPSVARIVLTGHAEREAIERALPVAHQFLSKPCDGEVLKTVIERTCRLRALVNDGNLRKIIGSLERLPSARRTYDELTRVAAKSEARIGDIAKIIERDPAMSAKALQIVNSTYFGLSQQVTSIDRAVSYLGVEVLKGLALTANVFATLKDVAPNDDFSLDRLQRRAFLTARMARRFVSDPQRADEAFTCALVHDVGKIIFTLGTPAKYREVIRRSAREGVAAHIIEREVLGITHAEVGAYLLGMWGLPFSIVDVVAHHHDPVDAHGKDAELLAVVHVADGLADAALDPMARGDLAAHLDLAFLDGAGFLGQLPRWKALAEECS